MRSQSSRKRLALASLAAIALCSEAQAAPAAGMEEVIVTGTRETTQTQFTAISPVDQFSAEVVTSTVTTRLDETLAQLVPSFNVKRLPTSDGPQFIRPASLNNLSPDMTLVLLNGKRFHRSAFLGSYGSQATDLAQIPTFATGRLELLRDGASAQYGSDAIAGVINIILDDKPGFAVYGQGSQYYYGDGLQLQIGGRAGFAFDNGGHLVVTAEYSKANETSRSHQRTDAAAFQAAHPSLNVPDPVQRWGNPDLQSVKGAVDFAQPVGEEIEAYAFGTFGAGRGHNDINWRNPDTNTSVFKTTTVFPGWDLRTVYPTGFTPDEGIVYLDGQGVAGIRHKGSDDFTWDLSVSYGRNDSRFFLNNSINASLGPNSPRNFNLGHMIESELVLNGDGLYRWHLSFLPEALSIAFGVEHRSETFKIKAGDPASYEVGPGAAVGLAPSSNGFPGFAASQAGSWTETSYSGYLDITAPITPSWQVEVALRDEDYSDFGNTFNYKFGTRYELTPEFAVRGSYSIGFKAPSPGQLNSTSTSQGLDTVTLQVYTAGRLSPLNPVAQYFGAKPLEPEESRTAMLGAIWSTEFGLTGSIDVFKTDVSKRFSTSSTFTVTPAIRDQLVALGVPGAAGFTSINFFTNDFNTMTRGVEFVSAYSQDLGRGKFRITGAYSYTDTKVTSGTLAAASSTQRTIYQQGVPQHNIAGTATYDIDQFGFMGRVRYYGPWTDSTGNSTGEIFQRFGGMAFIDVAVTYDLGNGMSLRAGAENAGNFYPEKAVFQASRGIEYSRNAPYDVNGGNYYLRYDMKF